MPTQETDRRGIGAAVKNVAGHAGAWFRLEKELAALELKKKTVALGLGIGLGIGAALVALYAIGFLFATIAAVLATFMDTWLALLTVTLFLLLVTGILAAVAVNRLKHGTPLTPEQAIREAQLTGRCSKAMSTPPSSRKPSPTEQARREVEAEREQLVQAVDQLRAEIADVKARMRRKLPFFAAGALAAGFFVAGGAGATARLLARRSREGSEKARFGRFRLVDRD